MASPMPINTRAFWRSAASDPARDLYRKKFDINPQDKLVTAGSCFAQHIAKNSWASRLQRAGRRANSTTATRSFSNKFGYNLLLCALRKYLYCSPTSAVVQRSALRTLRAQELDLAERGSSLDALRPNVEPNGLASEEEVIAHRMAHLGAVRSLLKKVDVFVFTFGLTEAWRDKESGTIYPTAPETIAGTFDPECSNSSTSPSTIFTKILYSSGGSSNGADLTQNSSLRFLPFL